MEHFNMIGRYTINMSFNNDLNQLSDIRKTMVEYANTRDDALEWIELIDETVHRALIRDNVTCQIEWFKR